MITYLLLAGDLPFQGTSAELVRQHVERQPAPLHTQKPGISPPISRVVMSGLEKYPADRPGTAAAFASLLRTNAEGEGGFVRRGRAMTAALQLVIASMIVLNTLVGTVLALGVLVQRLLDRGADPNLTPAWGLTPLMVAAMQGNMPVVRLLLARGADPRPSSARGKRAVDLALEENHTEVATLIRGFR